MSAPPENAPLRTQEPLSQGELAVGRERVTVWTGEDFSKSFVVNPPASSLKPWGMKARSR